jgi:hypothetical protein
MNIFYEGLRIWAFRSTSRIFVLTVGPDFGTRPAAPGRGYRCCTSTFLSPPGASGESQ